MRVEWKDYVDMLAELKAPFCLTVCVLHPFWVSLCAVTLSPGGLLCRSYLNPNPATHQPPVVISLSAFVSFSHRLYPNTFGLYYLTDCCSSLQSGPFYWTHNSSLCSRIIHNDAFFPPGQTNHFTPLHIQVNIAWKYCFQTDCPFFFCMLIKHLC